MEPFVFITTVHLDKPARDIVWDTIASVGNENAHKIVVEVRNGGKVVDLTGMSMNMYVQRHDKGSFVIEGKAENQCAAFTLNKNCYNVEGRICCTIEVSDANATVAVARIYLLVRKKQGDVVIDPENRVESLSEIIAQLDYLKETTAKANQAVTDANTATNAANTAANAANTAAGNANTAAQAANNAAAAANNAANSVEAEKTAASEAAARANAAAERGETAAGQAEGVIADCTNAAKAANDAADNANTAAEGVDAKVTAAQTAAENAEADAADTRSQLEGVNREIEALKLTDASKIDGAYIDENGMLCLTANGELVAGPFAVAGGGTGTGGGVSNAAVLTVSNESGFLAKTIALGAACPMTFNWSSIEDGMATGSGVLTVKVGGATKLTRNVDQGLISVDVGGYLAAGSNAVKVQISDAYGNSRVINFSITTVAVSLSSTFDASVPFTGAISFTYVPTGSVSKTMHFELDGTEIGTATVAVSGRQQTYVIDAQSHGAHALRAWFTCEIDGTEVTSNELYYELTCIKDGETAPIITSTFRTETVDQFTSLVIPWRVYDPAKLTTDVTLIANDEVVSELVNVDRTEQMWTYRAVDAGALVLEIACGEERKMLGVYVNAVDLNVSAETQDLALYLTSYGRSNSEAEPDTWVSGDVAAEFSGFNWTSDGWQKDEDGISVLRVGGDARLTIPLQIFAQDFRGTGKTIEIEFASRDVLNYDAVIMSCLSGGRGFEITSQRATLTSAASSIGTQYKENEHIRLTFVVEKRDLTNDKQLLLIYLNGVLSGAKAYPAADDFSQDTPVSISIGSSECTIDLYCIRVYDNALTRYQILDNWIADTQDAELMLERYNRNNIYDAYGAITTESIGTGRPYFVFQCAALPQFKKDDKVTGGYYVDSANPENNFTFGDAVNDVQGTSSQYYYVKNYKVEYENGFTLADGSTSTVYQLNENVIPTNTYTYKADVASSEGANNVVLAQLYNDLCPVKTPPQEADARVRQTIDGHPIVMFWDNGTEVTFLGKYNFNHDKGTPEVFGFEAGDESWEIRQNGTDRVGFRSADFSEGSGWENDFEARYPEDNTDTTNLAALSAWLVTTDPDQATGNVLAAPVNYDGVEYTTDTAEYRLAKFSFELEDHAVVDALVFYYVFTEIFLCIDQREKNAFPTLFKALGKWIVLFYDADSSLGTDNKGNLAFDPFLEDIDYTDAGDPVFNGQNSVLWANLRKTKYDKITKEYQRLRTTVRSDGSGLPLISYEVVDAAFRKHQSQWCEAIFNDDGYHKSIEPYLLINDAQYLPMLQGDKAPQRQWWLFNRFRYLDSKYMTGTSMTNQIMIRAHSKANITLISYVNMYGHVFYNSEHVEHRMVRGQEYEFVWAASGAEDAVIGINDADMLTSLGDLSALMVETIDISLAAHLTYLKVGDAAETYANNSLTAITLGNNVLLKTIDLRNCASLTNPVNASGCTGLEEAYFDGTSTTEVTLPNGGVLKKLHLPATITNLTIRNQMALTEFVLPEEGYSNITTLRLENVPNVVPTTDILMAIPANSRVRLIGFAWEMESAEAILAMYDYLDTMRGLDENGNNTDVPQMMGTISVDSLTGAQLAEMQSRYPSITIQYAHITSYCYFYNHDGTSLLYTAAVQDGGDATYSGSTPSRSSTAQYTYSFVGWSTSKNATSANANALKAVTADRSVYAAFSATVRTYTVYFYNGSTLLQTVTNVPYGGSATYTGETPVDADNGQPFEGWAPSPSGITGNTSCYAQFVSAREVVEITDDWATIFAAIDDGSYVTKYKVGNYKPLDLGTEGIINMQIAGFNKDPLADGTGTAPISWIGVELLKTSHRMNPPLVGKVAAVQYNPDSSYCWAAAEDAADTFQSTNQAVGNSTSYGCWNITPSSDGTLTINWTVDSESASYDYLYVYVNGTVKVNKQGGAGQSGSFTVPLTAGADVQVFTSYRKDDSGDTGTDTATVAFSADVDINISAVTKTVTIQEEQPATEGTGSIGGWEKSEMRAYLRETIKPLIPEEIRNRIRNVSKTQPAYNTNESRFTQTTEDDVWIPSYSEIFETSSLYKALFENTNANRVKYKVGATSASWWWLRSANYYNYFSSVDSDGSINVSRYANYSGAVPLGFCT